MLHRNTLNSKIPFILISILVLSVLFRFYNFYQWNFFGMDQEYEALLSNNIISLKHIPLIGVNVSDTGLYLGPYFIYFAALLFYISGGNPLFWGFFASCLGVFLTYLIYIISSKMFDRKVGILASLFYGSSFLASYYDRHFWNPTPVPLISLLFGYCIFQILKRNERQLIYLSILIGITFHVHYSLFIFLPLSAIAVYTQRRIFSRKTLYISFTSLLFCILPLIVFELRHNFLNIRALQNLILSNKNIIQPDFLARSYMFVSTLGRYFWVPPAPDLFLETGQCKELSGFVKNSHPEGILVVSIALGILFLRLFQKKNQEGLNGNLSDRKISAKIIIILFLTTSIYLIFYRREIFEYYYLFLFPWLAISLGWSVNYIRRLQYGKYFYVFLIIIFLMLNILTLFTAKNSYSYSDKIEAVKFTRTNIGNSSYSLEALGECPRYGGYGYLFEYLHDKPITSYMDAYFGWLDYGGIKSSGNDHIVLLSLIDPRNDNKNISYWEEKKLDYLRRYKLINEGIFGKIKIYIFSGGRI